MYQPYPTPSQQGSAFPPQSYNHPSYSQPPYNNTPHTSSPPPPAVLSPPTAHNDLSSPPYTSSGPRPFPNDGRQNSGSNISIAAKEIKLHANPKEREMYENMADMYSIIKTVEHLEKAYIRDSVSASEYTPACSKLIAQFKTAQNLLKDQVPDLNKFMSDYRLDCRASYDRLAVKGFPATLEHSVVSDSGGFKVVAETVQHFITAMDSVKLNMISIDQLHPLLNDVMESLNKNPSLPPEFEGKTKIKNWLITMNSMKASDELNEEQVRQLLFDLESSYNAFYKLI
eukprot:TRINITY_DN1547_c0_g1_i1.p1 TRINITY_DN1547_c0_g1~~TRINITY_DN1547_c0_g1_i1.p1  ORF type:complete len:285 (-),score=84.03 TRINITY_DN1547_c0_g1_i1:10-864(-)